MKRFLRLGLLTCTLALLLAIPGLASNTPISYDPYPGLMQVKGIQFLSSETHPWTGDGCGVHYTLRFSVTQDPIYCIGVGNNLRTVNTESPLLGDRWCKITVDDGRTFTPSYTDYSAGWSPERQELSKGVTTSGAFDQPIPEGISAGHTVTIEVWQRATSLSDALQPQILVYPTVTHGPGTPSSLVYGFVMFDDALGAERYMDAPFLPSAFTETPVPALPSTHKVAIDGKPVAAKAYLINGNNYFKLRDVAFALNGTAVQFQVGWNNDTRTISLTTGQSYTAVGGELAALSGSGTTGVPNRDPIYVNGVQTPLAAYHINDNNYFKLRDLGDALGFQVEWDETTQTVMISTHP